MSRYRLRLRPYTPESNRRAFMSRVGARKITGALVLYNTNETQAATLQPVVEVITPIRAEATFEASPYEDSVRSPELTDAPNVLRFIREGLRRIEVDVTHITPLVPEQ